MGILNGLGSGTAGFGVGFAEGFVLACRKGARVRGKGSVVTSRVEPLPAHLLSASAVEPNVRGVAKLARITQRALEPLGAVGRPVALALPDLALRVFVFPPGESSRPAEVASRIASKLPYPREEARVDAWKAPAGWSVAAAVRAAVLAQYEQALDALGCRVVWADGASLIPLPAWARQAKGGHADGLSVHLQLFSRYYTLTLMRGDALVDWRAKLRADADASRIAQHIHRLPRWHEGVELERMVVCGEGASSLVEALEACGIPRERIQRGEEGEENHMRQLLEMLLARV